MTDHNEKLIEEARRQMTDLDVTQSPDATRAFIRRLADALEATEKAHTPTQGSCWDAAPSIGHDPMPARCELTAGHLGAHLSGATEWMHGTPTDDEREALIVEWANVHQGPDAHSVLLEMLPIGDQMSLALRDALRELAGFRRFEVPEPRSCSDVHPTTSHLLPHAEPQGEPSDAQVLAALNAEDNMRAVQGGYKPREKPEPLSAWKAHDIERMRSVVGAALRAAGEATRG